MINKPMSTKEYIKLCIENTENIYKEEQKRENIRAMEESAVLEQNKVLFEHQQARQNKTNAFRAFSDDVRRSLLAECIYRIYDKALGIKIESAANDAIKRNLVDMFIVENGAVSLLGSFKMKTNLLSEMNLLVTKYHKLIIEAADKDNEECLSIDPVIKDNFFDELDMQDVGAVVHSIRTRVTDAVEEFIQGNINDKIDIETTLKDAQEKINAAKVDEVRESYNIIAKKKVTELRNNRVKNVFSCLVESMCKTILKNEALQKEFMDNGKINIDKIVERCELMYTFLETVNTTKIADVNEEYIQSVLDSMEQ